MMIKVNDIIGGFRITRIRPVKEQNGTLTEAEHVKTGALLAWLDRKEENKTFCISFKTVPSDDTGVFHILEHSVLNGSENYPVKEPFVELLKSSLQTFLNAFTYSDKTVYPVSSRNEKDFENLMRIYLDAVFKPRLHYCREIFDQEGWHYEPADDGSFTRNGVVLSEMKGAFSSVDTVLMEKINKLLFPDNSYRHESGGHPNHIPELTYEQYAETHRRFYHPSNARIILDGELPFEKILEILDSEYLSGYEKSDEKHEISMQTSETHAMETVSYSAAEGAEGDAANLMTGYIVGKFDEPQKIAAMGLLSDYFTGDNDSPLTKAILEKGLGQSVEGFLYDGILQPALYFMVRNTAEEKQNEILKTIREVLSDTVKNGIDKERMASLINNSEFHVREQNFGWMTPGVGIAVSILGTWNFGGDPMQNLESENTFADLRSGIDNGYFERLIDEVLLKCKSEATVVAVPDACFEEKQAKKEAEETAAAVGAMTEAQKAVIVERFEYMRAKQQEADRKEDLEKLPKLSLSDVDGCPARIPTEIDGDNGIIYHEIPTRGIQYIDMYFPVGTVDTKELPAISMATAMLCGLATDMHTSDELGKLILKDLGKLYVGIERFQDVEDNTLCKVFAHVSCSVMKEKTDRAVALIEEVLLHTRFDDAKRVRDILNQTAEDLKQSFIGAGHQLAINCASAAVCASGVVASATGGIGFYNWVRKTLKEFDETQAKLAIKFKDVCNSLFTKEGLVISVTGEKDEKLARDIAAVFPNGERKKDVICRYVPSGAAKAGVEIPAPVAYAVSSSHQSLWNEKPCGAGHVLAQLVSLDYLWQEVRVKGGAYGTGMQLGSNGSIVFYSYRDPSPARSLETYKKTVEYLRNYLENSPDLTGIILGTVAKTDPLLSAHAKGKTANGYYFAGITYEDRVKMRREVLDATPQDLLAVCPMLEKALDAENICVVGGADKLGECQLDSRVTL